uniref:HEPACAM family member 2-like isoform X2 n=1 Tax=Myxine glutinosa TaxID=7769 RepID=UPI00358F7F56
MRFQTSRSLCVLMYLALLVLTEADERIRFPQKSLYKAVGQSVLLNMSHDFERIDEIRWHWKKNSTTLESKRLKTNGTHNIVVKQLKNGSLMLEKVNKNYSGIYEIAIEGKIKNMEVTNQATITLIVQDPIESTSLDISPSEVAEGQTVKFTCIVNNGSDIKTILQRNGQKFNMTREVNDSRKFIFSKKTDKSDDGVYSCIARNEISEKIDEKKLNVYYGPTTVEVNATSPVKIGEGEDISIPCSAASNPPSDIIWKRYNKNFSHGVLKINNSKKNDSGSYTCVATNSKTNIIEKTTVNITIFRRPTLKPICSASLHNVTHVQLICVWENWKDPPQLKWSPSSTDHFKEENVSLFVKKDDAKTGKVYTCDGKSNNGDTDLCHLYSPTAGVLGKTQVSPGDRIFLRCESIAIPVPNVIFGIKESSASGISTIIDREQSITINNAPRCSTFHTKCTATNILGEKSAEVRVEVKCLKSMERGIIILMLVCLVLGVCLFFLIPKIKYKYAQRKSWNKVNGSKASKYTTRNALRTCIMNDPRIAPFNQALRRSESDNYEQIEFLSSSQQQSDDAFPYGCADYAVVQRNKTRFFSHLAPRRNLMKKKKNVYLQCISTYSHIHTHAYTYANIRGLLSRHVRHRP